MKNRAVLILAAFICFAIAGRILTQPRQPTNLGENVVDEIELDAYEELESNILDAISELDAVSEDTASSSDDILSIEPFELDPENEELGEIH